MAAQDNSTPSELLDLWDESAGWIVLLNSRKNASLTGHQVIYPCEAVHFINEKQSIAFVMAEEGTMFSRGFTYLRIIDEINTRINQTATITAKIDGKTVGELVPILSQASGLAEAEIFRLSDFSEVNGRRLEIITNSAFYEADATTLPQVIGDLRACQRERTERLRGDWTDDDYPKVHP